jgi:hypothetical protein
VPANVLLRSAAHGNYPARWAGGSVAQRQALSDASEGPLGKARNGLGSYCDKNGAR